MLRKKTKAAKGFENNQISLYYGIKLFDQH